MRKVLMVEDNKTILQTNREFFEAHGYEIICAQTAGAADEILNSTVPDCVVLDVDLPDGSGYELWARIRDKTGLPIVLLSSYTEEQSRVRGLTIGGDDYVCKPYSLHELELRVRSRIQTCQAAQPPQPLQYGLLIMVPDSRSASIGAVPVDFSTVEFDVLYFLAQHPGKVFSYEQIYSQVWKASIGISLKSLQVIIAHIRQKLLELCPTHDYIQAIRRKGFLFVP